MRTPVRLPTCVHLIQSRGTLLLCWKEYIHGKSVKCGIDLISDDVYSYACGARWDGVGSFFDRNIASFGWICKLLAKRILA